MAYASIAHVLAKNPARPITADTEPSREHVGQFIDEAAGLIDIALSAGGYDAPIPLGTSSVPSAMQVFLQHANAVGAAYMTERAAPVSDERWREMEEMFESALKMMRAGQLPLGRSGNDALPRSPSIGSCFFTREMTL